MVWTILSIPYRWSTRGCPRVLKSDNRKKHSITLLKLWPKYSLDLAFFLVSEVFVKNLFGWEVRLGYINVDEGCWRWNILATVLPFRSLTSIIFLTTQFRVLKNSRFYLSSEPLAPGTNIQKMSPRLKFYDQHPKIVINFTNITMAPTSLSSFVNHRCEK